VPRVRDLLYRFRPAGAPGAAAAAGVPVDRRADLTAELEPLFARLASTEEECSRIRERGRDEAEAIRRRAAERAQAIVAAADARTQAERDSATARLWQRGETESSALLAAAQQEAAAVRERAAERMPTHVARVLESVRDLLGEVEPGDSPVPSGRARA
jgi:vacuolar-type H+-ATPase subunit H